MSQTVENRVVSMQFDNKDFEKNASKSMDTLDRLKEKLKMDKVSNGIDEIKKSLSAIPFTKTADSVVLVQEKFSILNEVATATVANITDKVIDCTGAIINMFGIQPISTGLTEYETQLNAVQTILANTKSKGSTIDDVNNALSILNTYADKTIYNFTEMTRNIGTFTAAGIELEDATDSIKGIANLAAVSGSTAQQASTAMYQLSQALSAGKVSLQDWNSVVNAGMGGEVFQTALRRTSELLGTGAEKAIEKYGTFRESLSKSGWLTKEVLTETLKQLAGAYDEADLKAQGFTESQVKEIMDLAQTAEDAATKVKTFNQMIDTLSEAAQSGWTTTWQLIFGDFEEARRLFTHYTNDIFGPIIDGMSQMRNSFLQSALNPLGDLGDMLDDAKSSLSDFQSQAIEYGISNGLFDKEVKDLESFNKKYTDFKQSLTTGWLTKDVLSNILFKMAGASKDAADGVSTVTMSVEELNKVANEVIRGEWGRSKDRVNALTEAGYDYATVQNKVNEILGNSYRHEVANTEATKEATTATAGYNEKLYKMALAVSEGDEAAMKMLDDLSRTSGRDLIWMSVDNILAAIITIGSAIKGAWQDIFPPLQSEGLYQLLVKIELFTKKLILTGDSFDDLKDAAKGVFSVIRLLSNVFGGGFRVAIAVVNGVLHAFNLDIVGFLGILGRGLQELTSTIDVATYVSDAVEKIVKRLTQAKDTATGLWNNFIETEKVKNAITDIRILVSNFKDQFRTDAEDAKRILSDFFAAIKDFDISKIPEALQKLKDDFGAFVASVGDKYGPKVKKLFESIGKISDVFFATFTRLGKVIKFVGGVLGKVSDIIFTLVLYISQNLSILIAIIAGLAGLGFIKNIMGLLEGITGPLEALTEAFGEVKNAIKAYKKDMQATTLMKVAIAIGILALSIAVLAAIPEEDLWKAVQVLACCTVLLFILAAAAVGIEAAEAEFLKNKGGKKKASAVSNQILAVALAIALVAAALIIISRIEPEMLLHSIGVVILLLGVICLAVIAISKFAPKLAKNGVLFVTMALSIVILAFALRMLASVDFEAIRKNIGAVIIVFALMTVMIVATRFASSAAAKAGLGILAISLSLYLIIGVLLLLSVIDGTIIAKGLFALSGILLIIGLYLVATRLAGENAGKAGLAMLGLSIGMLFLVGAIVILANIQSSKLSKAVGALTKIMSYLAIMIMSTKIAGDSSVVGNILAMAGACLVLSLCVVMLSTLPIPKLLVASAALKTIMKSLTDMIKATAEFDGDWKSVAALALIVATVALVCYALTQIKDYKTAIGVSVALSLIFFAIGYMMKSLSELGDVPVTSLIVLGGMLVFVVLVASLLMLMSMLPVDNMKNVAIAVVSLSVLMLAMAATMYMIANAKDVPMESVLSKMAIIGIVGLIIVAIMSLLIVMSQCEAVAEAVMGGLSFLPKIGEILGQTLGSFVNGMLNSIDLSFLETIGGNLEVFMGHMRNVFGNIEDSDNSKIDIMLNIAKAVLAFTATDFVSNLLGSGDSLIKFGEDLAAFAPNFISFLTQINSVDVDTKQVTAIAKVLSSIVDVAEKIPNQGGILAGIVGDNTFAKLAEGFGPLIDGILLMRDKLSGIGADGAKIAAFTDDDAKSIQSVLKVAKSIIEVQNGMENQGGALAGLIGDNTLGKLAEGFVPFAESVVELKQKLSGDNALTEQDVTNISIALKVATQLRDFSTKIESIGGLGSGLAGSNDLGTFASTVKPFADALKYFDETISAINAVLLSAFCVSLRVFIDDVSEIQKVDTSKLNDFITSLYRVSSVDFEAINQGMKKAEDAFSASGKKTMSGFVDGLELGAVQAYDAMVAIARKCANKVLEAKSDMLSCARKLIVFLATGITMAKRAALVAIKNLTTAMVAEAKKSNSGMNDAGVYLAKGLIAGMNSMSYKVYKAGKELGEKAVEGEMDGQESESPSKATIRSGIYLGQGLIIGTQRISGAVVDAAKRLGSDSVNSIQNQMAGVETILANSPDYTPTVTPVMDLTNITAGSKNIAASIQNTGALRSNLGITINDHASELHTLINNTKQMVSLLQNGHTVTIDGKTVIGYVNRGLATM